MKRTKKGFTLVELLVVIAILAILASVSVVGYTAFIAKADQSVADQELHQIATLINAELIDDGAWTVTIPAPTDADANATRKCTIKVENNALTGDLADVQAMFVAVGETVNGTLTLAADGTLTLEHTNGATAEATLAF